MLAAALAARFRRPEIAAIGADRAARLICRGAARRRKAIALPGTATALLRTLRVLPSLLRDRLAAPAEPVAVAVAEEPFQGRAASGN
jgi:hypothetical protein